MINLIILVVIIATLAVVIYRSIGNTKTILFKAILKGASETPPNNSLAIGTATLVFDKTTKICTLIVNYSIALKPISAHIHKGAIGVAGPIIFPLDHTKNPIKYTSPTLTAAQEADLKANLYYVNIHTEQYPGGEIRGQLIY